VTIPSVAGSGKTTCILQVASSLPAGRTATIITYSRALKDECEERIRELRISRVVKVFTVHGLATKVSGRVCKSDTELLKAVRQWEAAGVQNPQRFDLVMLDEAQDLRPSFVRALRMIFEANLNADGIQMCLVGDSKQLLYDFPSFGDDKASADFMDRPEDH